MFNLTSAALLKKLDQIKGLIRPRVAQIGDNLYILTGGDCPSSSLKMVAAYGCLRKVIEENTDLDWSRMTLLDASSGNFALALAYLCRWLGLKCEVIVNSRVPIQTQNLLRVFGAKLTIGGDTTKDCYATAVKLQKERPDLYTLTNQLESWANPHAHTAITAPTIVRAVPNLKTIVLTGGSFGTACGIAMYLQEIGSTASMIVVRASPGSSIVGTASLTEGRDYVTPFMQYVGDLSSTLAKTVAVTEEEAKTGMAQLFNSTGIFGGFSTGAVYAGYRKHQMFAMDTTEGNVCLVSADNGDKWWEKFPH